MIPSGVDSPQKRSQVSIALRGKTNKNKVSRKCEYRQVKGAKGIKGS